ncbi:hypothetical protein D9756_009502 [Leucocoprinus leucothites]|uniref:Uncharacterized protein n=1 Tax=Leucocoprinus leucothites TaxID=201217 RepID=A0A8H5FU73_9AGAR|nr:hypothetical protein D9756_009502 [Leucoagaricus leucothites]
MSPARYQRLPTSPSGSSTDIGLKARRSSSLESSLSTNASSSTLFDTGDSSERGTQRHLPAYDSDPRFRQPKPSPYARAALLIFILMAFYIAFMMREEIWRSIIDQEEKKIQEESEKWAEWAAAQ